MPDISSYFPITDPTWIFFVVLLMILFAPIIMNRLRIPHIIGMVLAGLIVGKYGLNILERDNSFELFGRVGLYYIMFLAGLEMDMESMKKNKLRCLLFGLSTFLLPFILSCFMSMTMLGYTGLTTVLLGCILSSNTLVTYPIVSRYGLQRHVSVTISVGSSVIAMSLALVILAAVASTFDGNVTVWYWIWFAAKLVAYCAGVIYFVPRLARWFLRKYSDAVMQFIFVLSLLFFCAALSEVCGLEGIFGAFLAGLTLNRYIPRVSPLMNRIEFTGNALFIPYFLIGVGMLINVRPLFSGWHAIYVVLCLVIFGTLGKFIAAYASAFLFRLPLSSGHMMCGLTTAHAAGAIAIVMVGMDLGLMNNDMLNGIVLMVLFTCIISSFITEGAARQIVLRQKSVFKQKHHADDEKIVIPVTNAATADRLVEAAVLMRNPKLNRGVIGLNVVYDDAQSSSNQEIGRRLLEHLAKAASASDVRMITQTRIATNIANGIMHAFKEFDASEIIIGLHDCNGVVKDFWGNITKSLFAQMTTQIMILKCYQPLNTIRRIHVAVPDKAQFEPGFYRWLERLSRLAENTGCRIQFHAHHSTLPLISEYVKNNHSSARADYEVFDKWEELPSLAVGVNDNHLFVVVTARQGTVSYQPLFEQLPECLCRFYNSNSVMVVYPDQYGNPPDAMTFISPQYQDDKNAFAVIRRWIKKKILIYYDRR
jgi:Kef-type K+ transport system membrane component KefB